MNSLFRKIRQKLLSENRLSKYLLYAIGEIILVVIGILIALQVNNWNAEKGDQKRAKQLLKNLAEEIEQNAVYFNDVYTNEKDLFLSSAQLLFNAHSKDSLLMENDSLLGRAFRIACFTPVIKYSDNTYRELTASDLFTSIKSDTLKTVIHKYYGQISFLNKYSEQATQLSNNLIEELALYYEVIPASDSQKRTVSSFAGAGEENFSTEYDLKKFRENKSLNPKLFDMIDIHKDRLGGLEIVRELRKKILTEIEFALSN